ncbi:hypothetical protein CKY28_17570 [Sphingomonas lenta]|uniref:Uncharacterized protein n=2 Tax=Sphingomonas lenta TaxID=1141887 RepID=A0A2A2SAX7_9SPHN|nr:hypothetical protein CKY28_17570 [Sphingomonas lenta]
MVASAEPTLGPGFRNEGDSVGRPLPPLVREDADPELCKLALERVARHVQTALRELVSEDREKWGEVFDFQALKVE